MFPIDTKLITVTAAYKEINKSLWSTYHKGVDLIGGKYAQSICDGTISVVSYDAAGWGNYISFEPQDDPTKRYIYAHLKDNSITVKAGDTVKAGTILAELGSTGNSTGVHLHFQINVNGADVDPTPYIGIPNARAKYSVDGDNTPDDYARVYIDWAISNGYLQGNGSGDFMLHSHITRQDLFIVLRRLSL